MRRKEDSLYVFFRFPKNFKSSLALQVLSDTGLPTDKISPLLDVNGLSKAFKGILKAFEKPFTEKSYPESPYGGRSHEPFNKPLCF